MYYILNILDMFKKAPFSNMINLLSCLKQGAIMELVPVRKQTLTQAQFERLAGHARRFR